MSLLPYMVNDLHIHDVPKVRPNYGWETQTSDWLHREVDLLRGLYPFANAAEVYPTKSHIGKDRFEFSLDVQHFAPKEITVKIEDNFIVVDAKHEEKEDEHGHVYRHFQRRYLVPNIFDIEKVVSSISSDGILTVTAPKALKGSNIRHLQVQHTGPARLQVADKKEAEKK